MAKGTKACVLGSGAWGTALAGFELGRGKTLEETVRSLGHVAEGVKTTKSAYDLSQKLRVDTPITHEVYAILHAGTSPSAALSDLMSRELVPEFHPS